ncbi:class I SAM-dependent methyltransferase [Vulcaniibacterium tengchongense]|uniref:Calmodulin-lysine N-methyltransferase n=1 Tax=Vulcaniibacterium tengchongense TaxID=1273429 RepID=A0A3N4VPV8_9GAMM|nr:methyltransferase domain-containing protein [Vulcaniibacterium tengchongense]RPE81919.1 lysine methyltransferase [Vulcaniibacterium tengchongense]
MPGYATRQLVCRIGGHDYRLRALLDRQQFADPDGAAERAGISSAQWCLFGQPWPAGRMLAEAMDAIDIAGKRILEVGCGLGLSSLVLQRRGAEVVASDHHPLAGSFLAHNAALNGLAALAYRDLPWAVPDTTLGRFDLIIGSDVLYERGHAALLAQLIARHAKPSAEVVIADPGRGNSAAFARTMAAQGYAWQEQRRRLDEGDIAPFRGRLLHFSREAAGAVALAS